MTDDIDLQMLPHSCQEYKYLKMHAVAESVQITLHLDIEYAVHQRFIACVRNIWRKKILP